MGLMLFFSFLISESKAETKVGVQKFRIHIESRGFDRRKFRNLEQVNVAVDKYFNGRFDLRNSEFQNRCVDHYGQNAKEPAT